MKRYYFFWLIVNLFQVAYAQETKTEVFRTNSVINVPAGQKIECISAEGKYAWDSTIGTSSTALYKGPGVKIIKDGIEFLYYAAPVSVDGYDISFYGLTFGNSNSRHWVKTWVFSGDEATLTVAGPCSIFHLSTQSSQPVLLTYRLIEENPAQPVSASSVVIPTSATGDVDVKMEQSADNVTWTECLPGTYNSSTVKRFFRLRAVEK